MAFSHSVAEEEWFENNWYSTVSYCPHSHQTAQQKKKTQRQLRIAIPYLQNLHFNNLAMYTVQRSKHKHTSFTKRKGAACPSGSGRL